MRTFVFIARLVVTVYSIMCFCFVFKAFSSTYLVVSQVLSFLFMNLIYFHCIQVLLSSTFLYICCEGNQSGLQEISQINYNMEYVTTHLQEISQRIR